MTTAACPTYAGYRFPAEVISHAVWLYFRFPLSLRMVDELLAARGIIVSYETVRQWAQKFGQSFANQIRRRLPATGDKWHMDEVVITISGVKHWLWRAVDQTGTVLDILVQSRRDTQAAKRLLRKLLKRQCRPPRVMITDKLASYGSAKREVMPSVEHRKHYLVGQSDWLVNYAERHRAGLRVGTALTEGTANFLVNRRMAKAQQMRWTRRGADRVLQVRCAVYNGTLGTGFGQRFQAANDPHPPTAITA